MMSRAGFVLVGGRSSRMGRDKALLPYRNTVLAAWVARQVELAAGSVTLAGAPERYMDIGCPVIADLRPGSGPLAGIETALHHSRSDWNLVVACDMPGVSTRLLADLLDHAAQQDCDCLLPLAAKARPEPLCAVWHRRSLPAVRAALDRGIRKVMEALEPLHVVRWQTGDENWAANVNTAVDWQSHLTAINDD
jgi:molybdopterin-guanine dinucleotide biosynthesis protein A